MDFLVARYSRASSGAPSWEVRLPPIWTRLPPNVRKGNSSAMTNVVPTPTTVAVGPHAAPAVSAIRERARAANRSNSPAALATVPAATPPKKNAVTAFASPRHSAAPACRTAMSVRRAWEASASRSSAIRAKPASAANAFPPVKVKKSAVRRPSRRRIARSAVAQPTVPNARSAIRRAPAHLPESLVAPVVAIPKPKSAATASA